MTTPTRPATLLALSGLLFSIAVLATPLPGGAQPAAKIPRVGFLSPSLSSDSRVMARFRAFQQGMRELGYVESQSVVIEPRWAEGHWERLPDLAAELVRLKMDIIVTYGAPAVSAARRATSTIPIVMAGLIDPVAVGAVDSLAHPGGNVTGLSLMAPDLVGKQLEILKEMAPRVSRVAVLGNPTSAGHVPQWRNAQEAGRTLGLRLELLEARRDDDIDRAFTAMRKQQAGAAIVLVDSTFIAERARIAQLADKYRLPVVYGMSDHVEAGGLIAYGPSVFERYRRAAVFVDKILKGAKPGDLPVEQPTTFELWINLNAAKALALTIPPSLLLRADQVIR